MVRSYPLQPTDLELAKRDARLGKLVDAQGPAFELSAFDFNAGRLDIPDKLAGIGKRPLPEKPELPAIWEKSLRRGARPFARLLSPQPIPRLHETQARARQRVHDVRSYLGTLGAAVQAEARATTYRWRIRIEGTVERFTGQGPKRDAGSQVGAWQSAARGHTPTPDEILRAYYAVARDGINQDTSTIYDDDSDHAVLFPAGIFLDIDT